MSVGVRIEFNNGSNWLAPAERLNSANCLKITDVETLQESTVVLAHSETDGCNWAGSD